MRPGPDRLAEQLGSAALSGFLGLLVRLRPDRATALAGALGRGWARLGLPRTATGLVNLRIAFPQWSEEQRRLVLTNAFANLGRGLADVALIDRLSPEVASEKIRVEGLENLESALENSPCGGAIALTAHLGSWEILAGVFGRVGIPLTIVQREQNAAFAGRVSAWREHHGAQVVARGSAARATLRALRGGRLVAMLLDQNTPRTEGVFVPFFGRLACTRDAPARIAMRTGAPVVPVFISRVGETDRHVVRILPPVPMESEQDRNDDAVQENVRRMTHVIEEAIRRSPAEWIWNHRRWRTQPLAEPRPYPSRRGLRRWWRRRSDPIS